MKKKQMFKLIVLCIACSLSSAIPAIAFAENNSNWSMQNELYEIRTWEDRLLQPRSLTVLSDGRLLIADSANHQLKVMSVDQVMTYGGIDLGIDQAGLPMGGYLDGQLPLVAFQKPAGLTVDTKGNVYIADMNNHSIRKIDHSGQVTTLAGSGSLGWSDGKGKEAKFDTPSDVAVDHKGNVYVADTLNHVIRQVKADGTVITLTARSERVIEYAPGAVAAVGDFHDGAIADAKFNEPSGLVIDDLGNLYVSDRGNQRIRYIDFEAGTVTTVAGSGTYTKHAPYVEGDYADGLAMLARFNAPEGLALMPNGALVVADSLNHVIRLIKDGQVTTFAGLPTEYGDVNGIVSVAQFNHPTDIALLPDGRLAIADEFGNKIRLLQPYDRPTDLPKDAISIIFNGKWIETEVTLQPPGSVLLPIHVIGELLGFQVEYDALTKKAILTLEDTVYMITEKSSIALKKKGDLEQPMIMNGTPIEVQGTLFVPVRFFATENNFDIQWDGTERNVVIRHLIFE